MAKKVLHIYNEGETYAYRIQNIIEIWDDKATCSTTVTQHIRLKITL